MSALAATTMTPRGLALLRTFRAAFEALTEHGKLHPHEQTIIAEACASHLRSAWPMAAAAAPAPLETGPTPRIDPSEIDVDTLSTQGITILVENGRIELYRMVGTDGDRLELYVHENTGHDASALLTPDQAKQLLGEVPRVIAAIGGR